MLLLRVGLAAFVLAWTFDVFGVRATVPIWLPFLIALGLELQLFLGALRAAPAESRAVGRLPQPVDLERYGYRDEEDDELVYGPPRRRPFTRLLAGVGVIAALAGVAWLSVDRGGWEGLNSDTRAAATVRFSAEGSRIVGRPVEIRCDEGGDYVGAVQHADGVAAIGGDLAYLTPERCYDLYRLAFEGDVSFSQTARALAVLAHEAWHLRGERNEGVTECYALQSGVALGRRLGLRAETARQMMRQQLAENQLRARGSVEYLVPPECRDGGPLDLDPTSSEFP